MTNGNETIYPQITLDRDISGYVVTCSGGLTKREFFAAVAMLAYPDGSYAILEEVAESAVRSADALIEALNKEATQ